MRSNLIPMRTRIRDYGAITGVALCLLAVIALLAFCLMELAA